MFFYNHSEATRVMWTPPLRESFALPFLYLQLIFLSRVLRHASPTALDYVGLCLSSLCFLLPWQFSPLALLTQTLSLLLLHTLRVLPAGKHATILLSLAVRSISFTCHICNCDSVQVVGHELCFPKDLFGGATHNFILCDLFVCLSVCSFDCL